MTKFTTLLTMAILILILIPILIWAPIVQPDRAVPVTDAPNATIGKTIVGCWAYEEDTAYALVRFREDKTFVGLIQPKTLPVKLFVGDVEVSGTWDEREDGSSELHLLASTYPLPDNFKLDYVSKSASGPHTAKADSNQHPMVRVECAGKLAAHP